MDMSFGDMIDSFQRTEATPPLFYLAEWVATRVLGTDEVGMRLLPAVCGILTVPAAYAAAAIAASRRVGLATAALVAVNPFLVWYSQEARAYAPMILFLAVSTVCLAGVLRGGGGRWVFGWALASAAAIATHYFAAFMVAAGAAWLLWSGRDRLRERLAAAAIPAVCGLALVPLALHQSREVGDEGGIGDRDLLPRLVAIPKSFLVGYSLPLEAAVIVAAAALAGVGFVLASRSEGYEWHTARLAGGFAAAGILLPLAVAPLGFDYVSSKNVIGAVIPAAIALGCGFAAHRLGWAALAALAALSVATVIGVNTQTEHQRVDWRGAAEALGPPRTDRVAIFNPRFSNTGPFSVYFGPTRLLPLSTPVVREVAVVALNQSGGFGPASPKPPTEPAPPAPPGFELADDRLTGGYRLIRFTAPRPRPLTFDELGRIAFEDIPQVVLFQRGRPAGGAD